MPMQRRPDCRSRTRRARSGISLLGVLFSLCGIALVAMVAIPAFFERPAFTLDNVCDLLKRDLRSAQNRATYLRAEARFVFDADGWCALDKHGALLTGMGEDQAIVRRFSVDGVFEGVSANNIHVGTDGVLLITSRGTTLERGELVLSFRGEERVVTIERGSGQVTYVGSEEDGLVR
jgi:hypothetical protein